MKSWLFALFVGIIICSCNAQTFLELLVCDSTTECVGYECGTGVCGGDCVSICGANEICSGNFCGCDISNECNGLECGIGCNGGNCPNTCKENEICNINENTCACNPPFIKFNDKCLNCQVFGKCVDCTESECIRCETNDYHIKSGMCERETLENIAGSISSEDNLQTFSDTTDPSPSSVSSSGNNADLKRTYHYDVSIENGSSILCTCFLLSVSILFLIF